MLNTKKYCSYDEYSMIYDTDTNKFSVYYQNQSLVTDVYVEGIYRNSQKVIDTAFFSKPDVENSGILKENYSVLRVSYSREETTEPLELYFSVGNTGIRMTVKNADTDVVKLVGFFGQTIANTEDMIAICLERTGNDMRCSIGEAVSCVDHALYQKREDWAVSVGKTGQTKISFDKDTKQYRFELCLSSEGEWKEAQIVRKENILADQYHIKFAPVNKNATFSTPPVGWMTWYAVKFDACEDKVLENARWQAEHLKDYGANTIWVDWEWYHERMCGDRSDGVNSLMPDPKKYPHGMKYVADKIKELGLVPSLWIGYTNEPCENEFIEKYPDIVLAHDITWCGKYYYDFSNPHYLEEYLSAAIENVHKWGYEAVKYDTLPISIDKHEKYHMNMYNPALTTKKVFRNMIQKTRELLGRDMYMLSCSGSNNSTVLWASDIFDAARVGEDIFTWEEHLENVGRIQYFYPLHNIQLYVDPDNVVLREEFNNFEQAKSRAAMVSLLGLPMTFGDEFLDLSEDRIQLLKSTLPIMDIYPKDLCNAASVKQDDMMIHLNIAKAFEDYQVTGIFHLTEEPVQREWSLSKDLHLEEGAYLVYDYYRDAFLGTIKEKLCLDFEPYECRILAFRADSGVPQIISTSRHITQGAAELVDVTYKEDALRFTASLVANDSYTVSIFVPNGYHMEKFDGFEGYIQEKNLIRLSILPQETKVFDFLVSFKKEEETNK